MTTPSRTLSERTRRVRLSLLGGAALLTLSSCATFTEADDVASVGSTSIEQDTFDRLLAEYVDRGDVFGTMPAVDGEVPSGEARRLLGALVQAAATDEVLARNDQSITDADRASVDAELPEGHPWRSLSAEFLEVILDLQESVRGAALARVSPPTSATVEAMYRSAPESTGVVCLRHILVDTEAEAIEVTRLLDEGADFAELASTTSTEPAAVTSGGSLEGNGSACLPVAQINQTFDPLFVAGAYAAPATGWSDPVESSFGWHVIMHRPFDEVGDDVLAVHSGLESGGFLVDGLLASGGVRIDPRYGTWDPASSGVIAIG